MGQAGGCGRTMGKLSPVSSAMHPLQIVRAPEGTRLFGSLPTTLLQFSGCAFFRFPYCNNGELSIARTLHLIS